MRTEADVRMELEDDRPTTTPDGRPLPPRGERDREHMMGTSTNPGLGWGDRRGENYDEHMMGSSTRERMMGSSTEERPGIGNFFRSMFGIFRKHDASSTPPRMDGEDGMMASSSVEASTTPPRPAVMKFFQNFFGRFFR